MNLQDELIDHLAVPDSVLAIVRDNLRPEILPADCEQEREVLHFALDYHRQYGEPAPAELLSGEFGIEFQEPQVAIEFLLEKLRERYKKNQAKEVILKTSKLVSEDPAKAVDFALDGMHRIKHLSDSETHTLTDADWDRSYRQYQEKVVRGMLKGKTFGFEDMDNALGGIRGLTYVVARPKRFKSWMLLKAGCENRLMGERVSFFSLELPEEEMFNRYQCMMAGVSWSRFQHGRLTKEEVEQFHTAGQELAEIPGSFTCHRPPVGERTVRNIERLALEDSATLVIIDQLSWLEHTERVRADLRHLEVSYINQDLKTACDHFPIYIAAQFNREADSIQGMANLSQIGLSDSIGQTADMILGLYRDKEMTKNRLLQFGAVDSRSFEGGIWEIKVDLSSNSNFRMLGSVEDD